VRAYINTTDLSAAILSVSNSKILLFIRSSVLLYTNTVASSVWTQRQSVSNVKTPFSYSFYYLYTHSKPRIFALWSPKSAIQTTIGTFANFRTECGCGICFEQNTRSITEMGKILWLCWYASWPDSISSRPKLPVPDLYPCTYTPGRVLAGKNMYTWLHP